MGKIIKMPRNEQLIHKNKTCLLIFEHLFNENFINSYILAKKIKQAQSNIYKFLEKLTLIGLIDKKDKYYYLNHKGYEFYKLVLEIREYSNFLDNAEKELKDIFYDNPNRKLIYEIAKKNTKQNITQISKEIGLSYQNTFNHIKKLESLGFIERIKMSNEKGRSVYIKVKEQEGEKNVKKTTQDNNK